MQRVWLTGSVLALALVAVACGGERGAAADLPAYALRSEAAHDGYMTANTYRAVLRRLPCYCGCGQDPQYTDLAACFFNAEGGYNAHASNCAICLEEAADAAQWRKQEMSLGQVREAIDAKYEQRGPATATAPIAPGEEVVP